MARLLLAHDLDVAFKMAKTVRGWLLWFDRFMAYAPLRQSNHTHRTNQIDERNQTIQTNQMNRIDRLNRYCRGLCRRPTGLGGTRGRRLLSRR